MIAMIRDTWGEFRGRRMTFLFSFLTALAVLAVIGSLTIDFEVTIEGDPGMMAGAQRAMEHGFSTFVLLLVFVSVMSTAGLFPRMLRRGTADYYLSRPVSRASLYLNKLLAIEVVYGGAIVVCAAALYMTLWITYGLVAPALLWVLAGGLLSLLVWLSFTVFVGIQTGSVGMTISATFVLWIVQTLLSGWYNEWREGLADFLNSQLAVGLLDTLYYILPKMSDMYEVFERLGIADTTANMNWLAVWSTLLFMVALMWVTVALFQRRDY
ncbi:ABC transporter permease subunit [candidate division GN15 bacterium]|nr:ABC transporter permease subunit [candidate division GN15 bacterium]